MNKQKLVLRLAFSAILFTSLLGISPRANAGDLPTGLIDSGDSTSSAGDNFTSGVNGTPPTIASDLKEAVDVKVTLNKVGKPIKYTITLKSTALEQKLADARTAILTNRGNIAGDPTPGSGPTLLVRVLSGGTETDRTELSDLLKLSGLSESDTKSLIEKIAGLLPSEGNVDITRLNDALLLYNKIVTSATPATLLKLNRNKSFQEMRTYIQTLRVALK
jgi:hypothetical protein